MYKGREKVGVVSHVIEPTEFSRLAAVRCGVTDIIDGGYFTPMQPGKGNEASTAIFAYSFFSYIQQQAIKYTPQQFDSQQCQLIAAGNESGYIMVLSPGFKAYHRWISSLCFS